MKHISPKCTTDFQILSRYLIESYLWEFIFFWRFSFYEFPPTFGIVFNISVQISEFVHGRQSFDGSPTNIGYEIYWRCWIRCSRKSEVKTSLIKFEQVWSSLIQFDPVWSNLIQINQIRSSLILLFQFIQFGQVWSNLIHFYQV